MKVLPHLKLEPRTMLRRSHPRGSMSDFASKIAGNFEMLYVEDEDGIVKNKPQLDVAQEICEEIPTLYEAGVRFSQNVIDVFIAGAERAVIGSATLSSLDDLRGAFKLSENITFKVDIRDGIVSFDPAVAGRAFLDLARDIKEIGVADILVPRDLAEEAAEAKRQLAFRLGVFASVSERVRMEELGVDYIVSEDFGSLVRDE